MRNNFVSTQARDMTAVDLPVSGNDQDGDNDTEFATEPLSDRSPPSPARFSTASATLSTSLSMACMTPLQALYLVSRCWDGPT
jgi:hypothetical protein